MEKFKSQSCTLKTQHSPGSLWKEVLGEVRPQRSRLGYRIVFTSLCFGTCVEYSLHTHSEVMNICIYTYIYYKHIYIYT